MTGAPTRQLVIEIERVQTVRRRVPTTHGYCCDCRHAADLIDIADLARVFEVSVADAVLQLRRRRIHMLHLAGGNIFACADSLLTRSDPESPMLSQSLAPSSVPETHLTFFS